MKDYTAAISFQNQVLEIYTKAYGNKHPEIANTYNYLGNIQTAQEEFKSPIESFHKAIIANTKNFDSSDIYSLPEINEYYNGDLLLISLQQKARAFETYHFNKSLKLHDLQAALKNIDLCDKLIDQLRQQKTSEIDKIKLGALADEVYEDGIRICMELADVTWKKKQYLEKGFYFSEKSKAAVLLDAIAETNAKSFANIPNELLKKEQDLKTEIAYYQQKLASKPKNEAELRKQLFDLSRAYIAFTKELETKYKQYYQLKYDVGLPSVDEVKSLLDDKTALLSYFNSEHRNTLYIFVITKSTLKVIEHNSGDNLNRLIAGYRKSIYHDFKPTYVSTALELHKLLIPKLPAKINHLIIVPVGQLGIMPFESLLSKKVDPSTSYELLPYLINDYSMSIQYSCALLNKGESKMEANENICLLAPVEFAQQKLPALPGTATEVEKISNLFSTNNLESFAFTDTKASESVVKSSDFSNSKFIHFATHGVVDEENPELSQVFLSATQNEDGNLYSGEIYNLKLNADLVTLSACQTGLGKIHKGEGIVGLSRALLYSGANNLVVSLWSVADESTSQLMIDFYSEILNKSMNYSRSLQDAKLKMIKSANFSSPYYWAPFTLIGN